MNHTPSLYIGIMSGTSLDGIDIAIVEIVENQTRLVASLETPFTSTLKQLLTSLITLKKCNLAEIGVISHQLAIEYADAVNALLKKENLKSSAIKAIGVHGQTVFHHPLGEHAHSLQLVNASVLATKTSIDCVHNFREMDIALGGQGAPLVPLFHQSLRSQLPLNLPEQALVFANIGGIANLSLCDENELLGFDSGPGNTLIDSFTKKAFNKEYDFNGALARKGKINQTLLKTMLNDPYFSAEIPKSTGREYFNLAWLNAFTEFTNLSPYDTLTTLTELTAITLAQPLIAKSGLLILCGGGAKNSLLVERIQYHLSNWRIATSDEFGISADFMEAMAFAWMAYRTINKLPSNAPSVTGAKQAAVLGQITFAP
ncbi:anhydro-N-acetylmuramic acid kinase [Pseudoalteromonas sp. SSM20]|uniref:anhydro-N-acetylmuramic acid kinase n=1 Tax=Pseudoalteromonas sp. SSM20 TaxID=3139394 RepID=UPI003BA9A9ED